MPYIQAFIIYHVYTLLLKPLLHWIMAAVAKHRFSLAVELMIFPYYILK